MDVEFPSSMNVGWPMNNQAALGRPAWRAGNAPWSLPFGQAPQAIGAFKVMGIRLGNANAPTTRAAPFDFFQGCNGTTEVASFGSQSAAIVDSNPLTGKFNLNVQAAGLVATSTAKSGVGIDYTPALDGTIVVRATIEIPPPSFDLVYVTGIPKVGNAGIAGLTSELYISVSPPVDDLGTQSFRTLIQTPAPGGSTSTVHQYSSTEQFVYSRSITVTGGRPLRICTGIQSRATVTGFLGTYTMSKALYSSARLVKIEVIPQ